MGMYMIGYVCNIFILLMCIAQLYCLPTGETKQMGNVNGVHHEKKRSVNSTPLPSTLTLQHITNAATMTCNEAMTFPYSRMVQLNDDQMRAVFEEKGGSYVRDYMAATQEEAQENFPNMLILLPSSTIPGSVSNFSLIDNIVAKNQVISDLQKWTAFLTDVTSSSPLGEKSEVLNSTESYRTDSVSEVPNIVTVTENSQEVQSSKTTISTLASGKTTSPRTPLVSESPPEGSSTLDTSVSEARGKDSTTTVPSDSTVTRTSPTFTSTSSHYTTTLNPYVLKGLEQLNKYANHSLTKRDLDGLWQKAKTVLHPSVLLELGHGQSRRKRNTDGSTSREEYCQQKGHLTDDKKFKHLCSMCAATTKLPDDIFPRYINEVVCKTGDTDCFTVAGTAHGQCKQVKFSMNMLQKRQGMCKMLIHSGETLVFEDWSLIPQTIRVSCECTINRLSVYSQFVSPDIPMG